MGTRSMIGVLNEDGTATAIYCHWDGYPSNNGQILLDHYSQADDTKRAALLSLGDLSSLNPEIGEAHDFNARSYADSDPRAAWCVAYGRDRGETGIEARTFALADWPSYADGCGAEYVYLWRDGAWYVAGVRMRTTFDWRPLAEVLGAELVEA
jgi:hypothetical protein